ncbi:hypothetical protein AZF37_06105 [endosymbiont 'TC1' of Trimyema compressum]|uniref:hypothetical protein n=1 Tax=endosymbiont 'TC1' of Trimyema compressum TaxID=243899 RepID=UPI0007F17052|nr:hypothetical protein [endosymbiont 'TC1' of Trimyema compressum]AMP20801.1 hypothetical protein AZF37_06105 [endosymbiont 'TC1' of Trimyema compressum]
MDKLPLFSCGGDDQIFFPNLLIEKEKLSPQQIFTTGKGMAKMAIALKNFENKDTITIPFSTNIESEALGGAFQLGADMTGPIVKDQGIYTSMDDIKNIPPMNFGKGILKEIL